jgi:hypothetical protein
MEPWQTRASEFHPYMVDAVDALPARLRDRAVAALPPGDTMVRGFVAPQDYRSTDDLPPQVVPEQALIFTERGLLHVEADLPGVGAPLPTYLEPDKLLWMRSSHLLLYGRLEMVGAVQGDAVSLIMEFNAVGWRLIHAEWHAMVGKVIGLAPLAPEETRELDEQEKLLLAPVPDKFVDGLGRYGLYTGESLLGAVFQPAVWKENLIAFDEQLLPNTLVALTDASVLIMEEESALVRKSEQFGLIITRIPRRAIAAAASTAQDPLQAIRFSLAWDDAAAEQNVLLTPEMAEAWLKLWNSL